jgi:uncharacterized protein YcnI
MSIRSKSAAALAAALLTAGAASLALPALSSGHSTVSALQPQGPVLTGARGTFVVRSPDETEAQSTFKIVLFVPAALQESFSVQQSPDWRIKITRKDTGKTGEGGDKVFDVTRVSWTAKTKDAEIEPSMFGQWAVRWVNPITPQQTCFPIWQYYRNKDGKRTRPEVVKWVGDPSTAEHPRSCIDVVASAPGS